MSGSEFINTNLQGSRFHDVNLSGSEFVDINLSGTTFEDVALTRVTLRNVNCSHLTIKDGCYEGMLIDGILVTELLRVYRGQQALSQVTTSHASKIQEANAALIVRGEVAAIPHYFSPDYIAHLTGQDLAGGHEGVRSVVDACQRAFADLQVQVDILVESDDRIAWQRTIRGTQKGAFRGFPASGREIVWRDMVTSRFQDGLIAEEWVVTDMAERLLLSRKG